MGYRVIVWATGAIGKTCLRAVLARPDLELAGLFVYSERKDGVDAGTIARSAPTGVLATRSRAQILAIEADLVIHTARLQVPYETHDDDIIALLRSGKNVITTAGNHYPQAHGAERARRFDQACREGNTTLYGVGMNPGFLLERMVLGLTGLCVELESVEVEELLDASTMPDPDFVFNVMGMGARTSDVDLSTGALAHLYDQLYSEAIQFFGDRTGVTFDSIESDHRVLPAERDLHVSAGTITMGSVAATEWRWHGIVDGARFVTLSVIWTMDPTMTIYQGRDHWSVEIHGKPDLHLTLNMSDPKDSPLKTRAGQYITAGPVMNAIDDVIAAPAGIFSPEVFAPYRRRQDA
ncbi:MAG: dihydrodipicolinate reductase [Acidimicrobiaceae bacterium]|nr:dihydrodipicolinate reductase [Acidimicrobiaceae bacterium]